MSSSPSCKDGFSKKSSQSAKSGAVPYSFWLCEGLVGDEVGCEVGVRVGCEVGRGVGCEVVGRGVVGCRVVGYGVVGCGVGRRVVGDGNVGYIDSGVGVVGCGVIYSHAGVGGRVTDLVGLRVMFVPTVAVLHIIPYKYKHRISIINCCLIH